MTTTLTTIAGYQVRIGAVDRRTIVFVEDPVTEAVNPLIAELAAQVAALGERQYADRGVHPEVDDLYDRFNQEIAATKTAIAKRVIRNLRGVTGDVEKAAEGARFDLYAGCQTCRCTPGVVTDVVLRLSDGWPVEVYVEAVA